ncbi:hypothetical protein [Rhizobium leguminosarum]|uniref:hypothetical protein n=1 Tax=Rhizobium TaxID=379 RepID=UPI00124F48BD|nr:hypothetical protein [Rhizobium leguminosarum]KAF5887849.1 hypothetical protein FY112_01720 [Rhizobium sp. PEPV16]MBY5770906.1 hypothetical protein [Rhizobium leguminosarum]
MTEALFSEFLMIDRSSANDGRTVPLAGRRRKGVASERTSDENALRDAFADAFLQTLTKFAVDRSAFPENADPELAKLARAMANVAVGDSVVIGLKPDLPEGHRRSVKTFFQTMVRVSGSLEESRLEDAINKLADVILPDELGEARGVLAADNLELRDRFIAEVPQLTSAEIGNRAGSSARNLYATAARWKKAGDIFSVHHRGAEYFPAFQLRDGRPHPAIKKALVALPENLSPWQRAFWFVSTNGWLNDKAPMDVLDDIDAVAAAAARERQEVIG